MSASLAGSAPVMFTAAARPVTLAEPLLPATVIASLPLVPLTITLSAWPSPVPVPGVPARSRFTALTPVPVRSCVVIASAPPSVLTSICSTPLVSIVMLATSRKSREAVAVGRQVDALVDVGAVEEHRVVAALAFDDVAAVAGVPDERVVAGAEERGVVAPASVDEVVAGGADQHVGVVAAVAHELDRRSRRARRRRPCRRLRAR